MDNQEKIIFLGQLQNLFEQENIHNILLNLMENSLHECLIAMTTIGIAGG